MDRKKRWKKKLYENQEYPDNYTDETFLHDLRKNINFKEVPLKDAVLGATLLVQEFCTVLIFVLVYVYLYNEWVEPEAVFSFTSGLAIFGFILYRLYFGKGVKPLLGYDLRTVLIFLVFGKIFSPILHTLTDTISTDTIYTMSFLMMLIHLIYFDYGVSAAIVSNSLSLSAAVFGSVCLASRLASTYHAFVLITVAIECFVLFPLLRHKIRKSVLLTILLVSIVTCVLSVVSMITMVLFVMVLLLINIVFPMLFVIYQRHKDNIYGPWDEAVVDVDDIDFIKNKL